MRGQPGLAQPAWAGEHRHPRLRNSLHQPRRLPCAPHEPRVPYRKPTAADHRRRMPSLRRLVRLDAKSNEIRELMDVLFEQGTFQIAQPRTRLDSQLQGKGSPCPADRIQCVGLAARATEFGDQQTPRPLTSRIPTNERLQLTDHTGSVAALQFVDQALLFHRELQLHQLATQSGRARIVLQLRQRFAAETTASQLIQLGGLIDSSLGRRHAGLGDDHINNVDVHVDCGAQLIARVDSADSPGSQGATDAMNVSVQRLEGRQGWTSSPQCINEGVVTDRLSTTSREASQHRCLLGTQLHDVVTVSDLGGPEDPHLHNPKRTPATSPGAAVRHWVAGLERRCAGRMLRPPASPSTAPPSAPCRRISSSRSRRARMIHNRFAGFATQAPSRRKEIP